MAKEKASRHFGLKVFYVLPFLIVIGLCGYAVWRYVSHQGPPIHRLTGPPFKSIPIKDLTANFFTQGDQLRASGNDMFIEFRDRQGARVDVGTVNFDLSMKMPEVVMHTMGRVNKTGAAGQYRTSVNPSMAGEWEAHLDYSGAHGKAATNFLISVK